MLNHLHERRKYWVAKLASQMGRDDLSRRLGYSDNNYLNQVITGHTPLGNQNAKKWAEKLGLAADYLDQPIPNDPGSEPDAEPDDIDKLFAMLQKMDIEQRRNVFKEFAKRLPEDDQLQVVLEVLAELRDDLQRK